MEVLVRYGSDEQKTKWLEPLLMEKLDLLGMTEPEVVSSDATNMRQKQNSKMDNG